MAAIYEPSGAAREYSPLAMNYVKGCDHGCVYCYVPKILSRWDKDYVHSNVSMKEENKLLNEIKLSAKKHRNSKKQVFLSFLTDPYSHFNKETKFTRRVLEVLLENKIPVSILTKGGYNVLDDLDIIKAFGANIQVGASLTFTSDTDSLKWEKNAALPIERIGALEILNSHGVRTWASMEPVIFPTQSLEIMELTKDFIDGYKIGKLNHFNKHENKFDWPQFIEDSVQIMRRNKSLFYIKKDLLAFKPEDVYLNPHEVDMDYMALENTFDVPVDALPFP